MRRRQRIVWGLALAGLATLATLVVATSLLLRPATLKSLVSSRIAEHLNLETTLDDVELTWWPRPRASGRGLVLRVPGYDGPPFISVERFSADIGLQSAIRRHVDTLKVEGLKIAVPPGPARDQINLPVPAPSPAGGSRTGALSDIVIDHLVALDAELRFVPRKPDDQALTFHIHSLTMTDVALDRALPYTAKLTNPVPTGLVDVTGTVGPWNKDAPDLTPLAGTYVFSHAELATINGIGGTLDSTGSFKGVLTAIQVEGEARVPDFSLDLGGKPVPLTATFVATVNGTDGSTELNTVDATILKTPIRASGAITNLAGPGRHDVKIEAHIVNGRIEDVLSMVLDTPEPVMLGRMNADATMSLPPGDQRVRNRIRVSGRFGLASTTFTNEAVSAKIEELSRRSQGKDEDDELGRVLTNLSGRLLLQRGTVQLTDMRFDVPGARIALGGTYQLASGAMDFRGTLRMDASVSKAVGGFKSIFIKPFDPLFRKGDAGAVLPIKITGTREAPKYAVEMGKIFGRGDADRQVKN